MTRVMTTRERVLIAGELLWRKDGTSFLADYSAAPIIVGDEVRGAVVSFTDATERHRREREMRDEITARKQAETERIELLNRERAAREKAETAVRTRDEVLAIVSHDLRNPLNTISLAVGALESTDMPPEEETRTIQVVRRAVDRMNRLIADLLDVARLEGGTEADHPDRARRRRGRGHGDLRRPDRGGGAQAHPSRLPGRRRPARRQRRQAPADPGAGRTWSATRSSSPARAGTSPWPRGGTTRGRWWCR